MGDASGYTAAPPLPIDGVVADVRLTYVRRMYGYLMVGIGSLVAIEVLLFATGLGHAFADRIIAWDYLGWPLVLGGYTLLTWIATSFAEGPDEHGTHRIAYAMLIAAEVLLLTPVLGLAFALPELQGTVGQAAAISTLGFIGLSGIAITSARDFTFLGSVVRWAAVVGVLLIVVALFVGFTLAAWFSVAMIAVAGGAILWETQQVLRTHYEGTEFAAAMKLFSSVTLLFWYVLRLLMAARRE